MCGVCCMQKDKYNYITVMKKFLLGSMLLASLALAAGSCKKGDEPSCMKVMYVMDGVEVTTYQWMTYAQAQAAFSEYDNVRIYEVEDCERANCFMNNLK